MDVTRNVIGIETHIFVGKVPHKMCHRMCIQKECTFTLAQVIATHRVVAKFVAYNSLEKKLNSPTMDDSTFFSCCTVPGELPYHGV